MLTFEDCLSLCELTEDEVDAVAEHEHMGETAALELAAYLTRTPEGEVRIQRMIEDDLRSAQARGDFAHSAKLKRALRHFIETHRGGQE